MIAFALAIFISAFLIFQVQPLLGKYILPWFGGTPAVWTTCMLFFQLLLLGGYAYAHLSVKKFKPRTQFIVHAALLALSLLFLPIVPKEFWKPHGEEVPAFHILLLLCATVGLPYLALSATGPLLQAWFGRAYAGRSPYALYALSNIGSLLGLLSFPFFFEPMWGRYEQAAGWSVMFVVFALLCAFCAWMAFKSGTRAEGGPVVETPQDVRSPLLSRLLWIGLPAVASTLLLATTNQICVDVASIPFLWVVPLSIYLLSFIITFAGKFWYWRWFYIVGMVASMVMVPGTMVAGSNARLTKQLGEVAGALFFNATAGEDFARWVNTALGGEGGVSPLAWQVGVWISLLFFSCMVLHGEVYRLRPKVSHLTSFYLSISIGGALGGLFVGLIAPYAFKLYLEVHVGLVAAGVLTLLSLWHDKNHWMHTTPARVLPHFRGQPDDTWIPLWARIRYGHILFVPMVSAVVVLGGALTNHVDGYLEDVLYAGRNFYGALRVSEDVSEAGPMITLTHGVIVHGRQLTDRDKRRWPTTYYGRNSGVGVAIRDFQRQQGQRVGVVGLGAGTLASYGKPGDYYRIYEINPEVVRVATRYFTYLNDCEAKHEIALGDARVSMEHELERGEPQRFDVLALDAFSSDAIPVHLLTREAFEVYFKHLAPDGVLAVHISNRHLDLKPVVYGLAREFKAEAAHVSNSEARLKGVYGSNWVLVTRNKEFLAQPRVMDALDKVEVDIDRIRLWTDDYSNLLQVMNK